MPSENPVSNISQEANPFDSQYGHPRFSPYSSPSLVGYIQPVYQLTIAILRMQNTIGRLPIDMRISAIKPGLMYIHHRKPATTVQVP
jgi:hypothetical protein